jgi:hypothetical protein
MWQTYKFTTGNVYQRRDIELSGGAGGEPAGLGGPDADYGVKRSLGVDLTEGAGEVGPELQQAYPHDASATDRAGTYGVDPDLAYRVVISPLGVAKGKHVEVNLIGQSARQIGKRGDAPIILV